MSSNALLYGGIGGVLVASLIHIYIWILETFLWEKPKGLKTFRNSKEKAKITAEMARNQGLYNLMLAINALLGIWFLLKGHIGVGVALICAGAGSMAVAGIFLIITSPSLWKPALIQLTPPLAGVLLTLISQGLI